MRELHQSPTDPGFVQNPYPFYDVARLDGSLFRWADYDLICATSAAAVGAILRDRRFGRETPPELQAPPAEHTAPFYAVESHSMLELEPPRHSRLRGLVLRAFTSHRIAELQPQVVSLCHALIDALPSNGFDLIPTFAAKLPVIIIARLLGVPEERAPDLLSWSNAMVGMYQARRTREMEDQAASASLAFSDFIRAHAAERRTRPGDDLISHLIAAEEQGDRLTADELVSTCILLLNAGHEATVHTIGNGVKALLEYRAPHDALSVSNVQATVEEVLRYDPALHMFTRWAYEDIDIGYHRFRRGDRVGCLLAAANRDPQVWERPNAFDPMRLAKANVTFGAGLHFCVGAPLARMELQIALPILFQRLPKLRITSSPRFANLYHFHGLEALHLAAD